MSKKLCGNCENYVPYAQSTGMYYTGLCEVKPALSWKMFTQPETRHDRKAKKCPYWSVIDE